MKATIKCNVFYKINYNEIETVHNNINYVHVRISNM